MLRNEKGSVMSVAIILIVVLSFVISTASVYTYDISRRTTVLLDRKFSEANGQSYIDMSIQTFREMMEGWQETYIAETADTSLSGFLAYIEDPAFDGKSYTDLAFDYINETYCFSEVNCVEVEIISSFENLARTYRFYLIMPDERVLSRNLLFSISDAELEPVLDETEILDEFIGMIPVADEYNVATLEEFEAATGIGNNELDLEENVYYDGDLDLYEFWRGQHADMHLNGNHLIVNGNLYISSKDDGTVNHGVTTIDSSENMSFIIVLGDLIINQDYGLNIDNVLFVVEGEIQINLTHNNANQRVLQSTSEDTPFYMFGFEVGVPDEERTWDSKLIGAVTLGTTYYTHLRDDIDMKYTYISSKEYGELYNLEAILETYLEVGSGGLNFDVSRFFID